MFVGRLDTARRTRAAPAIRGRLYESLRWWPRGLTARLGQ